MPLVHFPSSGTSAEYRKAIGDGVHRAMVEAFALPPADHFQVITEHPPEGLVYDPQYLGVHRSDAVVFVQIIMSTGRKPQQKRSLYKRMAEILVEFPGLRPQELLSISRKSAGRTGRSGAVKLIIWTPDRTVSLSQTRHIL